MQAVLGDVGLEVHGPADGAALGAGVGGLVLVDPLVGGVTALVGEQHLADRASLLNKPEGRHDWSYEGLSNTQRSLVRPQSEYTSVIANTAIVNYKPKEKANLKKLNGQDKMPYPVKTQIVCLIKSGSSPKCGVKGRLASGRVPILLLSHIFFFF